MTDRLPKTKPGRRRNDLTWFAHLDDYVAFVRKHGRHPSKRGAELVERSLAAWITKNRIEFQQGTLPTNRRDALNDRVSDWITLPYVGKRGKRRDDVAWFAHLDDYVAFVRKHGRHPSKRGAEPLERSLASWIGGYRVEFRRGTLPANRREALDARVPDWLTLPLVGTKASRWQRNFEDYTSFVNRHDRRPSRLASDPVERRLANWMSRVRQAANGGRTDMASTPERVALLDEVFPDWRIPSLGAIDPNWRANRGKRR